MLSTRYLYLHEALGLGPMWLKRGAYVLPSAQQQANQESHAQSFHDNVEVNTVEVNTVKANTALSPATADHATVHHVSKPKVSSSQTMLPARAAALAMVNIATHSSDESPIQNEKQATQSVANQPHVLRTKEAYLQEYAGKLKNSEVLVLSLCPSFKDVVAGKLFSGEDGELLNKMLAAIQLSGQQVRKTSWLANTEFKPTRQQLQEGLPRLQAILTLCQAKAVLLLGVFFEGEEQQELITQLCGDVPFFRVPHPARILRQPSLKAQAWASLQELRHHLDGLTVE